MVRSNNGIPWDFIGLFFGGFTRGWNYQFYIFWISIKTSLTSSYIIVLPKISSFMIYFWISRRWNLEYYPISSSMNLWYILWYILWYSLWYITQLIYYPVKKYGGMMWKKISPWNIHHVWNQSSEGVKRLALFQWLKNLRFMVDISRTGHGD